LSALETGQNRDLLPSQRKLCAGRIDVRKRSIYIGHDQWNGKTQRLPGAPEIVTLFNKISDESIDCKVWPCSFSGC